MSTLSLSLVTLLAGCIIPTPLQPETQSPENHAPMIVAGLPVDFLSPVYPVLSLSTKWSFGVTAVDVDAPEHLYSRVYRLDGPKFILEDSQLLLTSSGTDPTRFSGEWTEAEHCLHITDVKSGQPYYYFVFVSDVDFNKMDDSRALPTGLGQGHDDYKLWVVTCS